MRLGSAYYGPLAALPILLGMAATIGYAAPLASGSASIKIIRPLSVAQTAQLNFGRLQPQGNGDPGTVTIAAPAPSARSSKGVSLLPGGTESPAIRTITGEPGRVYRITLPSSLTWNPGPLTINQFTLWSATRGVVTTTRIGQLDSAGKDTLRVGATISIPKGTKQLTPGANVPITISYE